MPNIKPISDLWNYNNVLNDVTVGTPVFLTKNGRGKYAILDMKDFEKTQATIHLMSKLAKGRKTGEEKGWLADVNEMNPTINIVTAPIIIAGNNAAKKVATVGGTLSGNLMVIFFLVKK